MKKYLLTLELRYTNVKNDETDYTTNITTIGVYDEAQEAYNAGNNICELLESKYKTHVFPGGNEAKKERFSKNGSCFGSANHLITDLAYLKTPFNFFLKITILKHNNIDEVLKEAEEARKRLIKYKQDQED